MDLEDHDVRSNDGGSHPAGEPGAALFFAEFQCNMRPIAADEAWATTA